MFYYYQMNINRNTSRCIGKSYLLTNCKITKSPQKQISEGFFVFCSKKSTFFKVAKMQFLPSVGNAFLHLKADVTTLPKCTLPDFLSLHFAKQVASFLRGIFGIPFYCESLYRAKNFYFSNLLIFLQVN